MDERRVLIEASALQAALGDAGLVLVDCRHDLSDPSAGRRAWMQAHIPGAVHASLDEDLSGAGPASAGRHPLPDPAAFRRFLAAAGIGPDTQVVAYDAAEGAMAAARLWWLLQAAGHRRAAVLDGGLAHWQALGLAVETGPVKAGVARYPALVFDPDWLADAGNLACRMDEPAGWLVDARAAERFRGEHEPIDPVAGHVPGAVSRPFTANLRPDGRFKPPAALREEWLARIGPHAPGDVVLMCGSGVTACHHALAMAHAGLPGASVYAPSWSGWVADPRQPVATGG